MAKGKKSDGRTRNWTIVFYPESAPNDWWQVIEELHTPALLSPLHEDDKNADGSKKKPHYHLLLMFDGVKTYEQVSEICEKLNAPIPQRVQSLKGAARYLIHMDNPEKAQYKQSEIAAFAGADVAKLLKPTASDRYALINEMREFIVEYNLTEFFELFDYAATNRPDDWLPLLCDNSAYVLGQYLKSRRYAMMSGYKSGQARVETDAAGE